MVNSNRAATVQRAAEMRQAAARKDRQRKQLIAAAVAVVVVIIAVGVGISIASQPGKPSGSTPGSDAVAGLAEFPSTAYDAAGTPTATNAVPAKVDGGQVRKDGDKPEVLYVGAEFCPYCATERWALVAALDRFGHFTGLGTTRSADNEGNLPTVSFVGAKYASDYVSFKAWETQDRNRQPLQELPSDIQQLLTKANPQGNIPWTFFGTHQTIGSAVPVDPFMSLTSKDAWTTIVDQIKKGQGEVGQPVMASANVVTAQICQLTNGQPANVCGSKAVISATPLLNQ